MKKVSPEALQTYLDESRGLERDFYGEVIRSRSTAWKIAVAACGGTVLSLLTLALYVNANRHPPPPAVIEVDKATGIATYLNTLSVSHIDPGWATDQQYIYHYVLDREGYDYNTIQDTYDSTSLKTSPDIISDFYAVYSGPKGREASIKDHARILVHIESVQQGEDHSASVRFETIVKYQNGNLFGPSKWIARIAYRYTGDPLRVEDRWNNALGFQVTSYDVAPEAGSTIPNSQDRK